MRNSILNYDTETVELEEVEVQVSDYFSKDVQIFNIFDTLGDYLDTYQIQNNDKLERIALELYGNSNYWDILLMLNDRNPLFEIPYEYDLVEDFAEDSTNYYKNVLYSHPPLNVTRSEIIKAQILEETEINNESYRLIYIIKTEKMNDFISLLKSLSYI